MTNKPHVLVDLTLALNATGGIPQSARQAASVLAQSPYWSTSALVRSPQAHELTDGSIRKKRGRAAALIPLEPAPPTDVLWEHYFAPGLPSQLREVVRGIRFYNSAQTLPEATLRTRGRMPSARLDTRGVDLIIFQDPTPIVVSGGTVKVIRLHNVAPLPAVEAQRRQPHSSSDSYGALAQCVNDGSYFACVSESTREAFLQLYPLVRHRSSVVPNSISIGDWSAAGPTTLQGKDPFFLCVGTIAPHKNYPRLLEAFRLFRAANGNRHGLVIVGSRGGQDEEGIRQVESAVKEGWASWNERVTPEQLVHLYRGAYALVTASVGEGFGLPPLEAASLGTPSVLSDLPVFRVHLGDAAVYFDPHDTRSIATALAGMTCERRNALAPLARSAVRAFRPENELAHWQELIRSLTHTAVIPVSAPVRITHWKRRPVTSDRPLTVVVGSERVDERLRECLDILTSQAHAQHAELIVGLRDPVTTEQQTRWPSIHFFNDPAGSVLSLRAQGIAMATGEVVAFTEDHALVCPEWCSLILESHRAHPEAAVIYGPVQHGGPYTRTSWANFFANFGLYMPLMPFRPRRRIPPIVAISIKRGFVPADAGKPGWFEFVGLPTFHDLGLCVYDPRQVITHVQHHGLFGTYSAHFHNARVTTGTRELLFRGKAWKAQFANSCRLPVQSGHDWATLWEVKAQRAKLLTSLPAYVGIVFAHMAGELTGLFFGSGQSAQHLD